MHRRLFIGAALAASALPLGAWAQSTEPQQQRTPPPPITPENELERVFLAALTQANMRPVFRRTLLTSQVALATESAAADSAPRELLFGELRTTAIFTSSTRLDAILGPTAPRRIMSGRQALERVRGKNAVINLMMTPMLTLEAEDVAEYLSTPVAN